MTYAQEITNLRNQVGDVRRRVHVDWTGDNLGTTIFQMPDDTFPVLDDTTTYVVKINGTTKTEGSDYSLDKEAGTLVFAVAPSLNDAITFDGSAVYVTNAEWLVIINDVIKSFGDDFWKEFVDDSNFTTTANMLSLSLTASQANCIAVYEFQHRRNTSEDWRAVEEFCNWRYDRDNNKIYIGVRNAFPNSSELLRIRGLKTYTLGTSITDTLDIQDKFLTVLEYGAIARFWRYRYKNVIQLVSKMSQESTRTPLQELIMLSDRFDRLYEIEKGKLKPQKPARLIPQFKHGGGRP